MSEGNQKDLEYLVGRIEKLEQELFNRSGDPEIIKHHAEEIPKLKKEIAELRSVLKEYWEDVKEWGKKYTNKEFDSVDFDKYLKKLSGEKEARLKNE